MQLLASQDGLPPMFSAGGNPAEGAKLWEAGYLVDFDEALTELGVRDKIAEGAVSTIEKLYGGEFNVLPYQYNIEGIFYNKKLFAENGMAVPETWDDFCRRSRGQGRRHDPVLRVRQAGLAPHPPGQRLPLPHLGPDALQKVADGEAKLTDPEYVKAAQADRRPRRQGLLRRGRRLDRLRHRVQQFLTGKAAMFYMGSWLLANINSDANKIGAENVGFMPFPAVDGGAGSIEQYPSNVGLPATFNAKTYGRQRRRRWLNCIAKNYGSEALKQGQISGFIADDPARPPDLADDRGHDHHDRQRAVVRGALQRQGHQRSIDQRGAAWSPAALRRGVHDPVQDRARRG